MPSLNLGRLSLHYEDRGEGYPILLLHAFPLSASMWSAQLETLSASHRVLALDARGFGRSQPVPEMLTMDMVADDAAALLDHLAIDRVVIGGLSMGGYATFAFWRRHRKRVRALILADTQAGADDESKRQSREAFAQSALQYGSGWVTDEMANKLQRPEPAAQTDWALRGMIMQTHPQAVAAAQRGMAQRPDSTAMLSAIEQPALVLVGQEDRLTPPETVRAMAEGLRECKLVELPNAGHVSNMEAPEAFNRAIAGFLAEIP